MASCKTCQYYTEQMETLGTNWNDIGEIDNHYCVMWSGAIPDGIYDGVKDCEYYEEKEVSENVQA